MSPSVDPPPRPGLGPAIVLARDDRLLSRATRRVGCRDQSSSDNTWRWSSSSPRHPKPRSAGIVRALTERGDERELFAPSTALAATLSKVEGSVPSGSTAALICDTGALIDSLVESTPDHRLFRNAIDRAPTATSLVSC